MVIDPRRKRFGMCMQLRQCFSRANPIRLKISQIFLAFLFPKKAKGVKKARISKSGFKKQIGNPATQEMRMRIKYARKLNFLLCREVQKT